MRAEHMMQSGCPRGVSGLLLALCLLQAGAASALAAPACKAASGVRTTALVELYTSEGCSSCPPADAWLSEESGARYRSDQLVPLALHVPYWDYIGWRDAFAQPAFAERQSQLVRYNGRRTVYTPHFFVSGVELPDWRQGIDAAIERVDARPAAARIVVEASLPRQGVLAVNVQASAAAASDRAELFLGLTEDNLVSTVNAGENRGATLRHDHVLRRLIGPLPMPGGRFDGDRRLGLDPAWRIEQISVIAFVQDVDNGEVLQAVTTAPCRLPD